MILGLTGGIASGKSTVSKKLRALGAFVIDADEISREVSNYSEVLDEIGKIFGKEIIVDKTLNRKELRNLIFRDEKKRELLNNIMHPIIVKKMEDMIGVNKDKGMIVLDIPLLYETKLEYLCDKILVVWIDEEVQVERIKKRDGSTAQLAKKILNSQMSLLEKLKRANYDIDNNSDLEELDKKIEKIYEKLKV